jgi:integrase
MQKTSVHSFAGNQQVEIPTKSAHAPREPRGSSRISRVRSSLQTALSSRCRSLSARTSPTGGWDTTRWGVYGLCEPTELFDRLVKRSGLPRLTVHGLRHSHATLALQAGVHPKVVQERLGHSSVAFTLDRYSHAIPAMQRDAAATVARLVRLG